MAKTGRRILQVGAGVILGLFVAFLLVSRPGPGPSGQGDPHVLAQPYPAPAGTTLADQHGRAVELPGDFDGLTAVFFGYTHCPDICPATMASLATVRDRLDPDEAAGFRAVLVTVDPARDTPERLAEYLAGFDTTFVGLTGTPEDIREVAAAWGAWAQPSTRGAEGDTVGGSPSEEPHAAHGGAAGEASEGAAGGPGAEGYLVDHTARTFLVDGGGLIVATFPASTSADAMLPTVRHLLLQASR